MAAKPGLPDAAMLERAKALEARFGHLSARQIVEIAIRDEFAGGVAAVSSFGADSAVLLDLIAGVDPGLPILFLDTGKHFEETLAYRDALAGDLGLSDVRIVRPEAEVLSRVDADGTLHRSDVDVCCDVRKVEPMARGLEPFGAWFTGRKRFQAASREALAVFEAVGQRIRINPLAHWSAGDLAEHMRTRNLRENPLVAYGYLSIGCFPCTRQVEPGGDVRSGRWAGQAKTECGIHLSGLETSLKAAS